MRVKVLAKEIERGIKSINILQARAYEFHIAEKPFSADWLEEPGLDALDSSMEKPTWDAENPTAISRLVAAAGVQEVQTYDTSIEEEEEDIIDLKLRRQVPKLWRLPSRYERLNFYFMICFCQRESQNTQLPRTLPRP